MSEHEKNELINDGKNGLLILILLTTIEIILIAAYVIWRTRIAIFLLVVGTLLLVLWGIFFYLWYRIMAKKVKSSKN